MINLLPLNRYNWEQVTHLQVCESQRGFIPSNLFSIAQSRFENAEPFGIHNNELMVGFLLISKWSEIHWITRLMIDHCHQKKGYGRSALELAIALLRKRAGTREIRTSISNNNKVAQELFESFNFQHLQPLDDKELVYQLVF